MKVVKHPLYGKLDERERLVYSPVRIIPREKGVELPQIFWKDFDAEGRYMGIVYWSIWETSWRERLKILFTGVINVYAWLPAPELKYPVGACPSVRSTIIKEIKE